MFRKQWKCHYFGGTESSLIFMPEEIIKDSSLISACINYVFNMTTAVKTCYIHDIQWYIKIYLCHAPFPVYNWVSVVIPRTDVTISYELWTDECVWLIHKHGFHGNMGLGDSPWSCQCWFLEVRVGHDVHFSHAFFNLRHAATWMFPLVFPSLFLPQKVHVWDALVSILVIICVCVYQSILGAVTTHDTLLALNLSLWVAK